MVKIFSLQGVYLSKFCSYGSGDSQFNNPQGLCFNSKGLLYVVIITEFGGEAFKRRLVHRVALTIMAKNNFVATALKNFILFKYCIASRNVWQRWQN